MQAITTKYLPATNFRGSRVKARAGTHRATVTIPYHDSGDFEQYGKLDAHAVAARLLARKFGWDGTLVEGEVEAGHRVFVLLRERVSFDIWK
tara:strand:- start:156 stop:431 length:276 start_codon:yes stop_codon:yes gene_type:complete